MATATGQVHSTRLPGRPAGATQRKVRTEFQPPLTPMIDVTFLLLIYFLLTMTFRQAEGQLPGSLPQTGGIVAGQSVQLQPVIIVVRPVGANRDRCIYELAGSDQVTDTGEALYEWLVARRELIGAEEPVIVKPTPNVRWQFVVEAYNQTLRAGCSDVGFASSW